MLTSAAEVAQRIRSGERLLLAAEEQVLLSLPPGAWIGGTIPYFMAEKGGTISREAVFTTPLPPEIAETRIATYDQATLPRLCKDAPDNGVTFLILPAASAVHADYAQNAPDYPGMFLKPVVGWIAGVHLEDLGRKQAKVVDGRTVTAWSDRGIALHGALPQGKVARVAIVNLFKPGQGDVLTFPHDGFTVDECRVNGQPRSFAAYLAEKKVDTRLPLVADYSGALVNVSFQAVDTAKWVVNLYAPVFAGVEYRIAEPVRDYVSAFHDALPGGVRPVFSCNCILNFLYSELEGKATPGMTGPVTFGEIAYQLLNQTLVYVWIDQA